MFTKRLAFIAGIVATLLLVALVVFRVVTRRESNNVPSSATNEQIERRIEEFVDVRTERVGLEEFERAVRDRSASGTESLTELERDKLLGCINRFYLCYSSGDFDAYAKFRLLAPFSVSPLMKSAVEQMGDDVQGLSEEEIFRVAWDKFNGTNRITSCDLESISLSVEERQDIGQSLRRSSTAFRDGVFPGAMCRGGSMAYEPTAESLLATEGKLRLFRFELNVRMNDLMAGPATPIVVMGYWDPTREDWMPLIYCSAFSVADYQTFF
jgi:hypothetical protein